MINIVLKENTRYHLDSFISDKKIESKDGVKYVGGKFLEDIQAIPHNPLTTQNISGVEFLEHYDNRDDDTLILKIVTKNNQTYIQTGNMVGEFYFKKMQKRIYKITIGLRFDEDNSHNILDYLLNFANAIYPDKVELNSEKNSKKTNKIMELLLTKMFVNSLSKAHVMGLPTAYCEYYEKDYSVRGSIDLSRLLSQEIPFKGKTPYIKNEREIVQSVGLVLLSAIVALQSRTSTNYPMLSKMRSFLQQSGISGALNQSILMDAMNHKTLNNPLYSEYKTTIYLASLILKRFQAPKANNMQGLFYGYLVDISKIWENYLVKLLQYYLSEEWTVKAEETLKLFKYCPRFLEMRNEMRPDIVLYHKHRNEVIVFDAKFKSSQWFNREDFYKTTTYVSYFQNHDYKVVLAGQIYPDITLDKINDNTGFLDTDIDFRFLGIDLLQTDNIKKQEEQFIQIIKKAIAHE